MEDDVKCPMQMVFDPPMAAHRATEGFGIKLGRAQIIMRLALGQEAVAEKSNEIVAIPLLLQRLDLNGALVTIDAMGTQTEIARTILDRGGDYILTLKENWPATHAAVQAAFAAASAGLKFQRSETIDADHGRIETRRHTVCHEIDWLFSDRRYPGEFRFPGLAALGMIEREREHAGTVERETHYYRNCSPRGSGGPPLPGCSGERRYVSSA